MSYGEDLRAKITAEYTVEGPAAQAIIDAIVATADELELMQEAVKSQGVVVEGSRGAKVANPALAAIARHRALLAKLIADAFPSERESVSEQAARAARSRWTKP